MIDSIIIFFFYKFTMKKSLLILCLFIGLLFLTWCDIWYTAEDYNNRGVYKIQNWDREWAIEDFKQAYEMDPGNDIYFDNWTNAIKQWSYDRVMDAAFDFDK